MTWCNARLRYYAGAPIVNPPRSQTNISKEEYHKLLRDLWNWLAKMFQKRLTQCSWNTSRSFSLRIMMPSSSYWTRSTSLSYEAEKHFSGLFDCTFSPLGIASGETSDICLVHCLSIPVFIERACALRKIDPSEAKILIWIDFGKSFTQIAL